jgi:hypothetical protein
MSRLTKEAAGREIATMRDEILQVLDHAMHPATALLTMTEVFALYVLAHLIHQRTRSRFETAT